MHRITINNPGSVVSSILGIYGGLLGFEHGIGEILQGNLAVPDIKINAYGSAGLPFPFGHEPAMTLLPTYLVTGSVAALTALLILWGYLGGMDNPSFNRETYTSLAMDCGLRQVFFALLAVITAAVAE